MQTKTSFRSSLHVGERVHRHFSLVELLFQAKEGLGGTLYLYTKIYSYPRFIWPNELLQCAIAAWTELSLV